MPGLPVNSRLATTTALYKTALELGFAALPLALVGYLFVFQQPPLVFRNYTVHETAIAVSIVLSLFASWVSLRCYLSSGEPALRYITLAFLGFALVYAPHGVLTRQCETNLWLFLLFGPTSRVVMAAFLLEALLRQGEPADPPETRRRAAPWLGWVAAALVVNGAVVILAYSPLAGDFRTRLVLEGLAIVLCLAGILTIRLRRLRSGLMWIYQLALAAFAVSSLAFLLTTAFTHLWWLAHALFAGGFFLLSHGIARSYLTTRSFSNIYSEAEMLRRLAASEGEAAASRAAEARLRQVFDTSPVGIVVAEPEGRTLFLNTHQAQMLGVQPGEPADERQFYADSAIRDRAVAEALHSGRPVSAELECLRADGLSQWSVVTWTPIQFEGRTCLVAWNVDMTDRRRAARALEHAKHAAEIANRSKTEFLAAMSHELRTPLNAIIGFSETMHGEMMGPLGNDRYKEYSRHILESGQHLTELINDVLDVAKVESGRISLGNELVQVSRLVEAAITMVAERAREAGITVATDLPADLPCIMGDERRLKQVLLNLLANAVKFTPEGGKVVVRARETEDHGLILAVEDNGIGIRPEDRDKALAQFGQVDSGLERRYQGLGLGLPLARNLVELHGGKLSLDGAVGKGTIVTVTLPATRLRRPANSDERPLRLHEV